MSRQDSANEISIFSIAFTDDVYRGEFEAISKIDDKQFILIPTSLKESTLIYNFESKETDSIKVLKSEHLKINLANHRITDATDIDQDSNLWLLGLKTKSDKKIQAYLIKAHFCLETKEITLICRYKVPRSSGQSDKIELNYEGLVQVSSNDFILCSDNQYYDPTITNGISGTSLVRIDPVNPQNVSVYPLQLSAGYPLQFTIYNMFKFSSAFNTETGICIMSQVPDSYFELACMITNKEVERIRETVSLPNVNNAPLTLVSDINLNTSYDTRSNDPVDSDLFLMRNQGIEAMTSCGKNYYGISSWVYPYLYTDGEVVPPGQQYAEYADPVNGPVSSNYDKTKVGLYVRPVRGIVKVIT